MVYTAIAYLALAGAAWLFLRLVQACFCLPGRLKRQNDVQHLLEEKVESYERYVKECEEKEAAGEVKPDDGDDRPLEERRRERQDCLNMLRRELKRIVDGGDPYDCSYLLEDEEKKLLEECEKDLEERMEEVDREQQEQEEELRERDNRTDAESEKQREDMVSTEKTKKLLEVPVPDVKFELKKDK